MFGDGDDMLEMIESMLPEGWESDADYFGCFDFNLICPHGHTIEQVGSCPEGCVSPLKGLMF